MSSPFTKEQLHLAAQYYYNDGLGQSEVAKRVNVSQAKVSRLLALAREQGIVQITVSDYDARSKNLEEELRKRFQLKQVVIISTVPGLASDQIRETVAHFAAPMVARLIQDNSSIAVAGGRTLRELILRLAINDLPKAQILQAMGNIDSRVVDIDSIELGRLLASKCKGSFYTLNTPAFLPDAPTRNLLLGLDSIGSVIKMMNHLEIALLGIGSIENSIFAARHILKKEDIQKLKATGAVGEICGRFFDESGRECRSTFKDRVIGIHFEQLQQIREVVAIVTEPDRASAIKAAIRGKLIKTLIVDQKTAEAVLTV